MKKQILNLTMAMAIALVPLTAKADVFGYTFTGNDGVLATGTLTGNADLTLVGGYDITSGTINMTGAPTCTNCGPTPISLDGNGVFVTNPGTGVFQTGGGTQLILAGTDSVLYPFSAQVIDNSGIFLFQMNSGLGAGLFSNEPNNPGYGMFAGNWTLNDTGNVNVNVAPEPSSLLLLGTGITGLAGLIRRRIVA